MKFNIGRFNLPDASSIAPVAEFEINSPFGALPFTVHFTDMSENNPVVWLWDFGDGTTSNEQNPDHTYAIEGIFTVKLFVVNSGGSNSITKGQFVGVIVVPPVADFDSDIQIGDVPLTVLFDDYSTGGCTSWLWDFGDGEISTLQNPEHEYTSPGYYTVKLTVSNDVGEDYLSLNEFITVNGSKPTADFEMDVSEGYRFETVINFTNTSTDNPAYYRWYFRDTNSAIIPTPFVDDEYPYKTYDSRSKDTSYFYQGVGEFYPCLEAYNGLGGTGIVKNVTITDVAPTCIFGVSIDGDTIPRTVTVTDTTIGYPTLLAWDWGDGKITYEYRSENNLGKWEAAPKVRTHVYEEPGTYTINLYVENTAGSDAFVGEPFTIDYAVPIAGFDSDTHAGYEPGILVQFVDLSTSSPTSWLWNFGDGSFSNDQNPIHYYNAVSSVYTVTLTATNATGSDTVTITDYITLQSKTGITIVAAANSSESEKFYADFICDSLSDNQSTINAAAEVCTGTLVFCSGTYQCNYHLYLESVIVRGAGVNETIFELNSNHMQPLMLVSRASDFTLCGNGAIRINAEMGIYYLARIHASNVNETNGVYSTLPHITNTPETVSKVQILVRENGSMISLNNVSVVDVEGDGFHIKGNGGVITAMNIIDCNATCCGSTYLNHMAGFVLNDGVSHTDLYISGCTASDNYLAGFYFLCTTRQSFIKELYMSECYAMSNGQRCLDSQYHEYKVGFKLCEKTQSLDYFNKETDELVAYPYAWIQNCVSTDNEYANYSSYGSESITPPMIIQDCLSAGSEYGVVIEGHNGIIFNRFYINSMSGYAVKTTNVTDMDFLNGVIDYEPETNVFTVELSEEHTGLRLVNMPRDVGDRQLDLSINNSNNLDVLLKSVINIGE